MCVVPALAALGIGGGAAAAGGGTLATGLTIGKALQIGGTAASVFGGLAQSRGEAQAMADQYALTGARRATEAGLAAVEDARVRAAFRSEMRRQTAELASRGIDLSSPSAIALGEAAAREMTFASQSVRSKGSATDAELSASMRILEGRRRQQLLTGRLQAGADLLTGAREIWPGLLK